MPDQNSLIGRQIEGKYKIIRHLGQGGMADVYLAEDLELSRQVAIKTMLPVIGKDEELLARFRREARATAQLEHPNIISVYAAGLTDARQPYLVMQYIERGSLSDYLQELAAKEEWVSPIHALSLARQIADALQTAHDAGIVHRDIKPSNILLRDDGTPLLTDLGIAAVQQATTRLTQTNTLMGTPHYMSPEQGSNQPVDGRADIYSLGVILFELLAGRLPFDADSPWGIIHQHIYEPPPDLNQLRAGLSARTLTVVARCLEKDPEHRYQTAAELTQAIDAALAAEDAAPQARFGAWRPPQAPKTIPHPRTTRSSPPAAPTKRGRSLFSNRLYLAGGGVALLLVVVAAFFLFSDRDAEDREAVADLPVEAATLLPVANDGGSAASTLQPSLTPLPTLTTLPTLTAAVSDTAVPPTPASLPSPSPSPAAPIAENSVVAFSCGSGGVNQIYLYDPDTDRISLLPNLPSANSIVPSFSPDGSQIVYRSLVDGVWRIYVSDLDGANRRAVTDRAADNFEAVFSPDGTRIAFVSNADGDKEIYVMNVSGANRRQLTENEAADDDPTWSPQGWIAYESDRNGRYDIYQFSPEGGSLRSLISLGDSSSTPAWSPDGERIAFEVLNDDTQHIWIASRNGQNANQVTTLGPNDQRPAWSPDGTKIAFHSNYGNGDKGAFDIWIVEIASQTVEQITERGDCYNPAWSPARP